MRKSALICLLWTFGMAYGDVIQTLQSFESRMPGTEGHRQVQDFIRQEFQQAGLDIFAQPFRAPMPVGQAWMSVEGLDDQCTIYPLWPNSVRSSALPETDSQLIYAGRADLGQIDGLAVTHRVVLLDFDCGMEWTRLLPLGPLAVVFIEPQDATRWQAEQKVLSVPMDIPRFWMARTEWDRIASVWDLKSPLSLRIASDARWETQECANLIGVMKGQDPTLSSEGVLLMASLDSSSVVPGLSPGADQSLGLACEIETLRRLKDTPVQRSMVFVALDGTSQSLAGARRLGHSLGSSLSDRLQHILRLTEEEIHTLYQMAKLEKSLEKKDLDSITRDLIRLRGRSLGRVGKLEKLVRKLAEIRRTGRARARENKAYARSMAQLNDRALEATESADEILVRLSTVRSQCLPAIQASLNARLTEVQGEEAQTDYVIRRLRQNLKDLQRETPALYANLLDEMRQDIRLRQRILSFASLQSIELALTDSGDSLALFPKGFFYDYYEEMQSLRVHEPLSQRVAKHGISIGLEKSLTLLIASLTPSQMMEGLSQALEDSRLRMDRLTSLDPVWTSLKGRNKAKLTLALDQAMQQASQDILSLESLTRLSRMEIEAMLDQGQSAQEAVMDSRTTASEIAWLMEKEIRLLGKKIKDLEAIRAGLPQLLSLQGRRLDEVDQDTVDRLSFLCQILVPGVSEVYTDLPKNPYHWSSYAGTKVAFNAEALHVFGMPVGALASTNDARIRLDTPHDTWDRMDLDKALKNIALAQETLLRLAQDPEPFTSSSLPDYACTVRGRVTYYDITKSFIPSEPIADCLAVAPAGEWTLCGVRTGFMEASGPDGLFRMNGLGFERKATMRSELFGRQRFDAFLMDPISSRILYAPDRGSRGSLQYPNEIKIDAVSKDIQLIVFPCQEMELYQLMDPRMLMTLNQINVYGGETNAPPMSYGFTPPVSSPGSTDPRLWTSRVEPWALVYGPEDVRLKMTVAGGVVGAKSAIVGSENAFPYGRGFDPKKTPKLLWTGLHAGQDMWQLDEDRNRKLKSFGIINDRLEALHSAALKSLDSARDAVQKDLFEQAFSSLRQGWGMEAKAYPDVMTTSNDVVKGVIFFLAMLFPFAVFCERLFVACPEITRRIVVTTCIFLAVFILVRYVHPAFAITLTPLILLLAFIMLALTVIVTLIVVGKFNAQLRMARTKESGYRADFERLSAASTAFSLGLSNMRRRRGRTLLTCISLILLTFTIISFTSVKSTLKPTRLTLKDVKPSYSGFLFRDKVYGPLESPSVSQLRSEFSGEGPVFMRAWTFSKMVGFQSHILVSSPEGKKYWVSALLGLEPEEWLARNMDKALQAGNGLSPQGDAQVLLSSRACQILGVSPGETLRISSVPVQLAGSFRPGSLSAMKDLDGEPITPVDYLLTQQKQQVAGPVRDLQAEKFEHLSEDAVAVVPLQLAMRLGGSVRSVCAVFKDPGRVPSVLDAFLPSFGREMFVSDGDKVQFISSAGMTSLSGLRNLLIPMAVAGLIVLNTMLGAVYERAREIGTYSALGLAPIHVASLFVAESCVYANLGGIAGYLVGQAAAKAVSTWGIFPGLTLNYSSLSVVASIALVMIVVVASTLYPSRQAAKLSVPDIQRHWKLPDAEGDLLKLVLPFVVRPSDSKALAQFLCDYLLIHSDESHSEFYARDIHVDQDQVLPLDVWCQVAMAPYDLGVSQWINVRVLQSEDPGTCLVTLTVERSSGDVPAWHRVNRTFLNYLRKQFLIWSTLDPDKKAELLARGEKGFVHA